MTQWLLDAAEGVGIAHKAGVHDLGLLVAAVLLLMGVAFLLGRANKRDADTAWYRDLLDEYRARCEWYEDKLNVAWGRIKKMKGRMHMAGNIRDPTYQDDTHYYTWDYDQVTKGYSIVCVPIGGTYDDRAIVVPVSLYTKQRAANYLHGMARRCKLRRVT